MTKKTRIIAKGIKSCQFLSTLNLSHNQIGRDGLRSLAINLRNNHTLTSLDISYQHQLGLISSGLMYLDELFQYNHTLSKINFSGNDHSNYYRLGNFFDFIKSIQTNTSLTHLNLSNYKNEEIIIKNTYIDVCENENSTSSNLFDFCDFFEKRKNLIFLDITGYTFSNNELNLIFNSVTQYKALIQFNIGVDNMPSILIEQFLLATQHHQTLLKVKINSEDLVTLDKVKEILESNTIISIVLSNSSHTKILQEVIHFKLKKIYNSGQLIKEFEVRCKLFCKENNIDANELKDFGSLISKHFYRNDYEKTIFFKGYQLARKMKFTSDEAQIELDTTIKKLNALKLD